MEGKLCKAVSFGISDFFFLSAISFHKLSKVIIFWKECDQVGEMDLALFPLHDSSA
jgi:hypothetical protein